jgi:hypothetical protein
MNALAESVVEATDEEIVEEVREQGGDPSRRAAEIRDTLLRAVGDFEAEQAAATPASARPGPFALLAAWLAAPAPRFALAALAICGAVALGVLLWPDEPQPPGIAHVTPTPQPPPPEPGPEPPVKPDVVPTPPRPTPNGKRPTPEPPVEPYPTVRTPLPPGVSLDQIKTLCVDFDRELASPGPAITQLRDAIVAELGAGGVFTLGACATADARVRLSEVSRSRLRVELVANRATVLTIGVPAAGSAASHARNVVARIVETVKRGG